MGSIPLPALAVRTPDQIDPLAMSQRANQIRNMMTENQLGQQQVQAATMENQQREQAIKDQQAMTAAMQQWDHKDPNELQSLILKNGGSANAAQQMNANLLTIRGKLSEQAKNDATTNATNLETSQKMHDQIRGRIMSIIDAPEDKKAKLWNDEVTKEEQAGTIQPGTVSKVYPGDDQAKQFAAQHALGSVLAKEAIEQQNADTQKQKAETEAAEFKAKQPGGALQPVDQKELSDWLAKNPGKGASDYRAWLAKLAPLANFNINGGAGGGLSDPAVDQAAEKYWQTGTLPSNMGRGAAGSMLAKKIMNRAAELHAGGSLAANSAEFKANADSLKKLQGNFDQVTAFENTAGKNLDVFLNQAQKVVDSGIPLLNSPVRMVTGKMGGTNQVAFDAARTTALTEIAKVLNSSNASGVLSDSARHEVEGLIGKDATLPQIVSAAKILKQDMANRHDSYQQQIDDIKGRLGGKASSTGGEEQKPKTYTPPAGAKTATGPNGHKIVVDGGKWVDAATGAPI